MRVLHVIDSLDERSGGPARALVGLAVAQQVHAGMQCTVLAASRVQDCATVTAQLDAADVAWRLVRPSLALRSWSPSSLTCLDELVRAAQVVHIHGMWRPLPHLVAELALRLRKPFVFRPCGMLDPWCLQQKRWRKLALLRAFGLRQLHRAALLHFTAEAEAQGAAPLRLRSQRVVRPNGVDLEEFAVLPAAGAFRQRCDELGAAPFVLFLGRLHPKKRLDLLLRAFATAAPPHYHLVVAGPDESALTPRLAGLAVSLGCADRVHFVGMQYGVERIEAMVDADLFVLASEQENFGIAVVEALAAGTPVLVSDRVAIHASLTAAGVGRSATLNVQALADVLGDWLRDPEALAAAAARAAPFVRDNYAWSSIARRWCQCYRSLVVNSEKSVR